MPIATLTSKGQLTLPMPVRKAMGLESGDRVDFVEDGQGGFRVVPLRKSIVSVKGRFAGRAAQPVSVDAMNQAVHDEAAARCTPSR